MKQKDIDQLARELDLYLSQDELRRLCEVINEAPGALLIALDQYIQK